MKKIDYVQIVKSAFNITKENKFLWWFGFLMMFCSGGSSYSYNFPGNSSDDKIDEMTYMNLQRQVTFYWDLYKEWIIIGLVVLLFIGFALYIFGLVGKSALIDSVFKILKKEDADLKKGFNSGYKYIWGIFLINAIALAAIIGLLLILSFPVIRLFILDSKMAAVLMAIMAIFIFISFNIFVSFLKRYAEIYLISSNVNPWDAFKLAYGLIEKNILNTFKMWLVCLGIVFILGIGMIISIFVLGIPLLILGIILYGIVGNFGTVLFVIIAIIIFLALIFFANSILNVFFQTIWILFFREIAKTDGEKEEEISILEKSEQHILENGTIEAPGVYNSKN